MVFQEQFLQHKIRFHLKCRSRSESHFLLASQAVVKVDFSDKVGKWELVKIILISLLHFELSQKIAKNFWRGWKVCKKSNITASEWREDFFSFWTFSSPFTRVFAFLSGLGEDNSTFQYFYKLSIHRRQPFFPASCCCFSYQNKKFSVFL
jgi:hypothetical protein